MKKSLLLLLCCMTGLALSAQFVAQVEMKEHIPGICNDKKVYALFPSFKGQVEAVCPVSKEEILERLNKIDFLKDNPAYEDKGMINLFINCKGEVVQCKMDTKTKSTELDKQIEAVFNSLGEWKAGTLNGNEVDTSRLFSFTIKDGKFTF